MTNFRRGKLPTCLSLVCRATLKCGFVWMKNEDEKKIINDTTRYKKNKHQFQLQNNHTQKGLSVKRTLKYS